MNELLRRWAAPLLTLCLLTPTSVRADDEADVKKVFADLQKALKAKDAEQIWPLLDAATQKTAEREAETIKTGYLKTAAKDRPKLEKALGMSADELSKLTGKTYLKSKKFLGKNNEVADGKVTRVAVDGDKATVFYTEEDGDKVKMELVRQDGKWKVVMAVG
jgi:hypothetical protein